MRRATDFLSTPATRATIICTTRSAEPVPRKRRRARNRRKRKRMPTRFLAYIVLAGLMPSTPVWAHHAFATEFDINKPVKLQGKVTSMEWINPHAWIHIDVIGPDGKV